jgi:hypothetical protein
MDAISITCLVAIGLLLARPAYAYIDPGTGGMLIQLVTGGVAGLAILARLYWRRIRSIFAKDESDARESRQTRAPSARPDERG